MYSCIFVFTMCCMFIIHIASQPIHQEQHARQGGIKSSIRSTFSTQICSFKKKKRKFQCCIRARWKCKITTTTNLYIYSHGIKYELNVHLVPECETYCIPFKTVQQKTHKDLEGSIILRSLFPALVTFLRSTAYTAEHRPLLATSCKQQSGSLELQ